MAKKIKTRIKPNTNVARVVNTTSQEPEEGEKKGIFKANVKGFVKPISRLVGHTVSAATAYGCFCAAELIMAKVLHHVFTFGTPHQRMLFETGETLVFYVGFAHWAITFLIGAVRLIITEFNHPNE